MRVGSIVTVAATALTVAVSAAAAPAGKRGLAAVALEVRPAEALGGRLLISPPKGARAEPRGHSIMAADAPAEHETRFVVDVGKVRVVTMVIDTTALAPATPAGLVDAVRAHYAAEKADPPDVITALPLPAPLRAAKWVPGRIRCKDGACLVATAFVAAADWLVEKVLVYVDDAGAADADGARALAGAILASVRAGPRAADLAGGKRKLGVLFHGEALVAEVPRGAMLSDSEGPDFSVYRVDVLAPLNAPEASVGVYVGHAPSFSVGDRKPVRTSTVVGTKAEWYARAGGAGVTTEETLVHPAGTDGGALHVFLTGAPDRLPALRAIADSLAAKK